MNSNDIAFITALKDIYESPGGRLVFDELYEAHVVASSLDKKSSGQTHYDLGQKELILGLFTLIEMSNEELRNVTMETPNDRY